MDAVTAPEPVVEVAFGLLVLVGIIFVHGTALRFITRRFNAAWMHVDLPKGTWRADLLLGLAIAALALTHLAETLLWSLPIYALGMIPTMRDTYFFVLECYTTLGAGTVALPDAWRLVGPIIAMSGVFTFGWTTGVLVAIMSDVVKLDRNAAVRASETAREQPERRS